MFGREIISWLIMIIYWIADCIFAEWIFLSCHWRRRFRSWKIIEFLLKCFRYPRIPFFKKWCFLRKTNENHWLKIASEKRLWKIKLTMSILNAVTSFISAVIIFLSRTGILHISRTSPSVMMISRWSVSIIAFVITSFTSWGVPEIYF